MTELHLACAADARYVAHSAAMLHSALTRGGGTVVAHYLHAPTFPEQDAELLAGMVAHHGGEIVFHEIADDEVSGLPLDDLFGAAMWYRVFLPELLPDVGRILYLDVDTIIAEPIAPLWELDLDAYLLAAVTNVCLDPNEGRPRALGIDPSDYFNSGVLMFNLESMRRERYSEALLERARREGSALLWPDQDALNLTAAGRRLALHPRWNSMNSLRTGTLQANDVFGAESVAEAMEHPAIRHFEGPGVNKPWHVLHDRRGRQLYDQHRRATPWPDYALEEDSVRNRLRRWRMDMRSRRDGPRTRIGSAGARR
jgi:lipopolysaccharide biosynthesis glycosyltransferase